MTPNKKRVMLPHTLAKAGWDVVAPRDDIDAVGYDPYISMPDLQAALKDTDGIALSLTPLKGPEVAAAPRLRVAARIGVGYDAVDIPALTAWGAWWGSRRVQHSGAHGAQDPADGGRHREFRQRRRTRCLHDVRACQ